MAKKALPAAFRKYEKSSSDMKGDAKAMGGKGKGLPKGFAKAKGKGGK